VATVSTFAASGGFAASAAAGISGIDCGAGAGFAGIGFGFAAGAGFRAGALGVGLAAMPGPAQQSIMAISHGANLLLVDMLFLPIVEHLRPECYGVPVASAAGAGRNNCA
jgi:hypothetical protein